MDVERPLENTIVVERMLPSAPVADFARPLGHSELWERAAAMEDEALYSREFDRDGFEDRPDAANIDETPRAYPAVSNVVEMIEAGSRDSLNDTNDRLNESEWAQDRADLEAVPLVTAMQHAEPLLRDREIRKTLRSLKSGQLRNGSKILGVAETIQWAKMVGDVVSLKRVYHPVPVVVGAVPAQAGASGELIAEFERSKAGGIEVAVAAAGGSFVVHYSINVKRSVVLEESTTGDLVVGFGELLIPLDRQVLLVPMSQGGEPFRVERFLPVQGAQHAIGWNSREGTPAEIDQLTVRRKEPLRGTAPQKGSQSVTSEVKATVSLGWANASKTRSVKASMGVSAKVTLGSSWELPAGDFTLGWAESTMVGALIR